jgi:hypothetical protein
MQGPHEFDEFNPNNPYTQLALLAQRVDNLGKEKEALERNEEKLEARIQKLESMLGTEKMEKIENAIQFMNNAEFMGKWTWRGIAGIIFLSGSFFGAFKFWKGS